MRTGIFVTPEELEAVRIEHSCSGMFLPGGRPMGDPACVVDSLMKKYNQASGTGLDMKTGEFVYPDKCVACDKPVMHFGEQNLCCRCYVQKGHPPADWHRECMRAYAELKA